MPMRQKTLSLEEKTSMFTVSLDQFIHSEDQKAVELLGRKTTSSVSKITNFFALGKKLGKKRDEVKNKT